jgi:hypothetical protein
VEFRVVEKKAVFFVGLLLCFVVTVAQAANTIYVDAASPNDPGSGTFEDPFRRVQDGINVALPGDTVLIMPGIYTGSGNYDLDPNGKSITICSSDPNDPDIIARTIIDPEQQGRGFYIHSEEDANCIISGLTIKNGYIYGNEGAGIYCSESDPTIANCILTDNYAEAGYGGAICCKDSNSLIENCVINGNSAYDGGGVECFDGSSPRLINCIISNNRATGNGGGVDCYYQCFPELTNCSLINNIAEPNGSSKGGGISLLSSSGANIKNSILWSNDANTGAQLYVEKSSASLSYCDIQGGISDVCSSNSNVIWGDGNIDTDPCFALFDPNGDPNLWDLHLQSSDGRWNSTFYRIDLNKDGIINLDEFAGLAGVWLEQGSMQEDIDNSGIVDWLDIGLFAQYYLANSFEDGWITDANTSPCIDRGDPNSDWSAEPWPNGKRINMGAYGGTNQASKSGNIADLNLDGVVNFFDLAQLGKLWGENQETIEDLDNNGTVDIGDLDILATNWLWEKQ